MARRKLLVFIRQVVQSVPSEWYVMGLFEVVCPVECKMLLLMSPKENSWENAPTEASLTH